MARSYMRRKAARKGGLLVRENPVTRIESVNSLYPYPVHFKLNANYAYAIIRTNAAGAPKIDFLNSSSGDPVATVDNVVRISSIHLSSKSPFKVTLKNTAGGTTAYQCKGQCVNKIIPSRETSVMGNPATLWKAGMNQSLALVSEAEDEVDVTVYCVVDSVND